MAPEDVSSINEQIKSTGNGDSDALARLVSQLLEANQRVQNQLQHAENKLQDQAGQLEIQALAARTDVLTSLLNRRGLNELLAEQAAESERSDTAISVMMSGVDHFKKFNDTHGHQAGDEVLRGVGRVLRDGTGDLDIPTHHGGEEFAVIFPGIPVKQATTCGDLLRQNIEKINIRS